MSRGERYFGFDVLEQLARELSDICEPQYNDDCEPLQTVFPGHRPSATDNHTEFLVVSLSRSVYSHGPYQNAACYIDIYVKNGQGGVERTWRLQEILDSITSDNEETNLFPMTSEEPGRWTLSRPKLVISGDDTLGFTAWRVRLRLFVNTTDRYGY